MKKTLFLLPSALCCLLLFTFCKKGDAQPLMSLTLNAAPHQVDANRAAFVHPGGYLLQNDLTRVRTQVAAGAEPWASAWNTFKNSDAGLNYSLRLGSAIDVSDAYAIQTDGHAAWALTVKWVASGNTAYAAKAISIIDTWVNQVKSMSTDGLRTGLGSNQMANAAEILAWGFNGAAGWPSAKIANAKVWFKAVPYTRCNTAYAANWGTSAMSGCMAMAIFCDDNTMLDNSISIYKNGFNPLKKGCCGVTQYIDATGENAESGRDQPHSQGGIAHLLEVAMMAWNQNINLINYNDNYGILNYGQTGANRLFIGFEYVAKYNLGENVAYHPFFEYCNNVYIYPNGIATSGRGEFSPMWEMAVNLFKKASLSPVYSQKVVETAGYRPEKTNGDHAGLGTLLFTTKL